MVDRVGRFVSTEILEEIKSVGYSVTPFIIPAVAADAKHRRDRIWIVGYAGGEQTQRKHSARLIEKSGRAGEALVNATESRLYTTGEGDAESRGKAKLPGSFGVASDAQGVGLEGDRQGGNSVPGQDGSEAVSLWHGGDCAMWPTEPELGRVAHGIPRRVDRLKGLGNAIVPQVAFEIIKEIRNFIE